MDPVFLVGAERSGTTVFRLMLNEHPEIEVCSEFEYVVDLLVNRDDWPDLEDFHEYLRSNWIFQDHGFEIDTSLSYPELAKSFMTQALDRGGASRVVAVVHRNFDQLRRIWGQSDYIHIVRDPRDVARSNIGMGWAGNVWHGVARWLAAEQAWARMRDGLSEHRYLEIRYEELVRYPEKTLSRVCNFLELRFDPVMLEYAAHSTYSRPDPELAEQWNTRLSRREISLIEARVGRLLEQTGYQSSGYPSKFPSALGRRYLSIHDMWKRTQFRLKDLGFRLYMADLLSRRLGMKYWQQRVDPKLRAQWKSRLK